MDRIGGGFVPPAISTNNDFNNFTAADSTCNTSFSVKNHGGLYYINPKINCSNKSVETGKYAGMSSKGNYKFVERKRRRDMKTLFSTLRSLLPEEYIMGNCSTAEQLSESANYIIHLREKIKKLEQKREETRKEKMCRNLSFSIPSETFPIVKVSCHEWDVLVSTNTQKNQIFLSDLLLELETNGVDVITAIACAANDKVSNTIHAKVADLQNFHVKALYQGICNLVGEKHLAVKGTL